MFDNCHPAWRFQMVVPRVQGAPCTATIYFYANFPERIAHTKYGCDQKLENHAKEIGLALGFGKVIVVCEELPGKKLRVVMRKEEMVLQLQGQSGWQINMVEN